VEAWAKRERAAIPRLGPSDTWPTFADVLRGMGPGGMARPEVAAATAESAPESEPAPESEAGAEPESRSEPPPGA
jgi:hypothetical protein